MSANKQHHGEPREQLDGLISRMWTKLQDDNFKPTVADWLRLVEAQKEWEEEEIREVTVRWIGDGDASEE